MSNRSIGSRIAAVFAHMRDNSLLWGCIFAAIGTAAGVVRYLQAEPSHWGDLMAFGWMACGLMIVIGGERYHNGRPELATARND